MDRVAIGLELCVYLMAYARVHVVWPGKHKQGRPLILGTLYFKFGELDETKPAGSVKIRVETIIYYLEKYSKDIIERKLKRLGPIPKELLV